MKSPIHALRQRKCDLVKSSKAILAASQGRTVTTEEEQNLDKFQKALAANEEALIAEEARLIAENSGEAMPDENSAFARMAAGEVPTEADIAKAKRTPGKARYRDLFGAPARGAFQSFGEFVRAVNFSTQLFDPRLKMAGREDTPSDGGFLVPPDQAATVWDQTLESEIVRPRSVVVPMVSESRKWPAVADDDHSGGQLFGGMAAGWAAELEDLDTADMKTRLITLTANKFGLLQNSSNELLEDTVFESTLSAKFQAGCAWHLDNAFLFGDGVGKPRGALSNHAALVVATKQSWQAAGSFVYENACDMYSTMAPASLKNAVWLFSSSLVPQLLRMQNVVKNVAGTENVGGSAVPILTIANDGSMTLLTRPVIVSEKLQAPGTQGDAAFIDFTQYCVGMRREIRLERSSHAGFANDSTWFRLTCRVDGQPLWAKSQKLKNAEVISPFVVLQAR